MFIGGKLILQFVLLQSFAVGALCCLCPMMDPGDAFYKSEFVLKVVIRKGMMVATMIAGTYDIDYLVSIEEVFKGEPFTELTFTDNMIHLTGLNVCIPFMALHGTYLIHGKKTPAGELEILDCYRNMHWPDLTPYEREFLFCSNQIH